MPTFYLRIFVFYNLIYSILLYILPKKLKKPLTKSPHSHQQQIIQTDTVAISHPSPRKDHTELTRIFQMFDTNLDGRITKQELNQSLQNMNIFITDSDLTQLIDKVDANNDGFVDIREFGDLYETIMDDNEDMVQAFNVFDQNGDGFISIDELKSVLVSLGLKQGRKTEDCRKMIMKVDVDGDGVVSFSEFKQMMRSGGFATMVEN